MKPEGNSSQAIKPANRRPTRPEVLFLSFSLVLSLALWARSRTQAFNQFLASAKPVGLTVLPYLMSAAVGSPSQAIGYFDQGQVHDFADKGGLYPGSLLDIRQVSGSGDVRPLWLVDWGIAYVWNLASHLGVPLSLASLAGLQLVIDFFAMLLAAGLAVRLQGWSAGVLAGLLYARSSVITAAAVQPGYYYWSIPLALVAGHLLLSSARNHRPSLPILIGSVFLSGALWVRALWFPIAIASQVLDLVRRRRHSWRSATAGIAIIALSYSLLVRHAAKTFGGDLLHPRSQLWHTLYIGLGYYNNFGPIHWQDEYAFAKARAAGYAPQQHSRYERYMRSLFVQELTAAPSKYALTLGHRFFDYMDHGFQSLAFRHGPPRATEGAFGCFTAAATLLLTRRRPNSGRVVVIGLFYLGMIMLWSVLVPPLPVYASECLGLVAPLYSSIAVAAGHAALHSRLLRRTEVANEVRP